MITRVACCALLQGIFPTQGSNPRLFMSPALADGFLTPSTTWEALTVLLALKPTKLCISLSFCLISSFPLYLLRILLFFLQNPAQAAFPSSFSWHWALNCICLCTGFCWAFCTTFPVPPAGWPARVWEPFSTDSFSQLWLDRVPGPCFLPSEWWMVVVVILDFIEFAL